MKTWKKIVLIIGSILLLVLIFFFMRVNKLRKAYLEQNTFGGFIGKEVECEIDDFSQIKTNSSIPVKELITGTVVGIDGTGAYIRFVLRPAYSKDIYSGSSEKLISSRVPRATCVRPGNNGDIQNRDTARSILLKAYMSDSKK